MPAGGAILWKYYSMIQNNQHPRCHVPVLVLGGGITGLSAALFLLQHGIKPLLIERHRGTSIHPRSRGFDIRTMELFRELGLGSALREAGKALGPSWGVLRGTNLADTLQPIVPRTDGKITFPSQLKGLEKLAALSPESGARCTQDIAEPLLKAAAIERGGDLRFYTELVSFTQDDQQVTALVRDRETGQTSTITADYMIAADGARSTVREQLQAPVTGPGVIADFLNIYFEADMAALVKGREFSLCIIDTPGLTGFVTSINNSNKWVYQLRYFPEKNEQPEDYTDARLIALLKTVLGFPELPVRIISVLPWQMTVRVANEMQYGRIFLAGDAAHVMTPYGGKGANTGIQDVHNLAWKLAAVLRKHATGALLATYTKERQPVGLFNSLRSATMADEMGILKEKEIMENVKSLIGIPDYQYRSAAILNGYTPEVQPEEITLSGLPGTRVPHLWLDEGRTISTLDLAKEGFVLITVGKKEAWSDVAKTVAADREILTVHVFEEADAITRQWQEITHMQAGDVLLVRPDGFVAWRFAAGQHPEGHPLKIPLAAVLS